MPSWPVSFSAHHFNLLQYNDLFPPRVVNYQVQSVTEVCVLVQSVNDSQH